MIETAARATMQPMLNEAEDHRLSSPDRHKRLQNRLINHALVTIIIIQNILERKKATISSTILNTVWLWLEDAPKGDRYLLKQMQAFAKWLFRPYWEGNHRTPR
jgi:hypothetical protein